MNAVRGADGAPATSGPRASEGCLGARKEVVAAAMVARGRGSGRPLTTPVAFVWTFNDDGLLESVETYRTREEALDAAGLP